MEILDNVGKIVTDTYKSATKASSKLIEESKLKFLISDNEAQMKEIYQNIGKEYCNSHFKGESFDEAIFENDFELHPNKKVGCKLRLLIANEEVTKRFIVYKIFTNRPLSKVA